MKISLNKKILDKNEECALQNSSFFKDNNTFCINVISSPGSGKTTILSRTIRDLEGKIEIGVIEGDIRTDTDTRKIRSAGASAVQIETKGSCHLSAEQVTRALGSIPVAALDVVFVENVGNLVCPSAFDLGENARVVVLSLPEGDDKPIKYPGTFAKADVLLINKMDFVEYVDFDMDRVLEHVRKLKEDIEIFKVSAKTGEGMGAWYEWLTNKAKKE